MKVIERTDFHIPLERLLAEFAEQSGYSNLLKPSEAYFPHRDRVGEVQYPCADEPGCYVFFDGCKAKYVGKAARCLGDRIWAHIGRLGKEGEASFPNADTWFNSSTCEIAVISIPVQDEHWWIALALEGFLVEQFFPEKGRKV